MEEKIEAMRQLIEMAVACGRKRKSSQTGYLHHCHNLSEQEPHLPIPLVENFLYALALFRSRTIENVNEAKILLDGLLHFQNVNAAEFACGNFPIYMHDYPVCKDKYTGIHVAAVICCILKQFNQIIGQDLRPRLERALEAAVQHALVSHGAKPGPYPASVKLGAAAIAAGKLLGNKAMEHQGTDLLDKFADLEDACWYCPEALGEIVVALLLIYPKISESPWKTFWNHLEKTWHRGTGSYVGPGLKEWQDGEEPQVTLYDLFMGYLSGEYSERAKKETLLHLEGALILPCEDMLPLQTYPLKNEGEIKGVKWKIYDAGTYAYCCVDQGKLDINPVHAKGFHPFKLLWGDLQRVHTFMCQDGNAKTIHFEADGGKVDMDFALGDLVEFEDRESSREVAFFVDAQDGMEFLVGGEKSSTFKPEEVLTLVCGNLKLQFTFVVKEGDGRYLGHRMPGNRPAQIAAKGAQRYSAFDWQIFLRTVRRPEESRIGVNMKIEMRP